MTDNRNDPIDLPDGAYIRRPDPMKPTVAMSSRYRWSKCPASALLPQLRTPAGPAAAEGTEAHKVAEWAMQRAFGDARAQPAIEPPEGLDDPDLYTPEGARRWEGDLYRYAQKYATHAASMFADATGAKCLTEYKIEGVELYGVKVFTVVDVALYNPHLQRLVIGDYKFGRSPVGVGTATEPNPQCAGAAVLLAHRLPAPPSDVQLFVYQPRTMVGEPFQALTGLSERWVAEEMNKLDSELAAIASEAASMARGDVPKAVPGEHCTYCPSARWCPAAAEFGVKALQAESNPRTVADLSPDEVMALWAQRSAFSAFEEDLKERVRILHEHKHPAVSVRYRKGSPKWLSDAAAVEAILLADRMDLLKPPAISKVDGVIPADQLAELTGRYPDIATYVSTTGKRPDVASNAFAKYLTAPTKEDKP
ncbi:hypothetical protein [Xanthomonas phage XPP1]|uniref:DUF2800 domain-containing protein n=1 Tax=Xanthomonas phage XPP1 TaxID=2099853 RepID=A0A3S7HD82_9CAUD|nr:exonuclease [Xanthomonas phage XPP1]AVO23787.1 hypothetical protein [Xanthomonas phage XPP2]AVO23792.1 hypothetical protein [Xanthomonas phage XPP3]AVO23882.1 hypothetical protein [Xanthomonas phage XPP4]AVO23991.1 hypothetical protein [Xanthomonas phage XPP6]AVO24030.1 hypothetical protein [Xanthomonas phage XPP8]